MYQVLTERAIIVDLDVHSWTGQKLDKDVSKDVATRAGSLSDPDEVGRYTKYLVAREALAPIKKLGGEIRAAHLKFTMPWIGDSRVLPVALYPRYVRVVDGLIRKRDAAREEFIDAYPRHMREAKRRLVKLFDPSEYPSISKLRELITAEYGFTPMPSVDHLAVVGLTRRVSVRIRKSIERQIERRVAATVLDLDKKLGKPIAKCCERLTPERDGKPKTFKNTLVTNLRESAELVIDLNITEDVYLHQVATHFVGLLDGVSPGQLRVGRRGFNRQVYNRVKASVDKYSRVARFAV